MNRRNRAERSRDDTRDRSGIMWVLLAICIAAPASVLAQSGPFVYVANCGSRCFAGSGDGSLSAYVLDPSNGTLTQVGGSPFTADRNPHGVKVDPTGQFAYAVNDGSNTVSAYTIDRTTGALTPVVGSPFPTGLRALELTVDPTGRFLYVPNLGDNAVSAYTIDRTTGALTPIDGSPFPGGSGSYGPVVDPTGTFLYVANFSSDSVSAYVIDQNTGALTPVDGSPFAAGSEPVGVAVVATDPGGEFLYVANCGSGSCGGVCPGTVLRHRYQYWNADASPRFPVPDGLGHESRVGDR